MQFKVIDDRRNAIMIQVTPVFVLLLEFELWWAGCAEPVYLN